MSRRTARKHAFILIYQFAFHDNYDLDEYLPPYFEELGRQQVEDLAFIRTEVEGTLKNLEHIDTLISEHLSGWEIDRINKIDLALIRLAIYEMLYLNDIPASVSINEAVELAKVYGTDDSYQFVNGILGKVLQKPMVNADE